MTKIKNWWNWYVDGILAHLESQRQGIKSWLREEAALGEEMKKTLRYAHTELALTFLELRIEIVKALRWGKRRN